MPSNPSDSRPNLLPGPLVTTWNINLKLSLGDWGVKCPRVLVGCYLGSSGHGTGPRQSGQLVTASGPAPAPPQPATLGRTTGHTSPDGAPVNLSNCDHHPIITLVSFSGFHSDEINSENEKVRFTIQMINKGR